MRDFYISKIIETPTNIIEPEEQEPNNNLEQNEGEQNPDYDNDQEQNMLDPDDEVEGDIPPTEGQEEEPQDEDLGY